MFSFVRTYPFRVARHFSTSSESSNGLVGFIGLGNMGGHMVSNLIKNGRQVMVYDVNQDAVSKSQELGARAGSLRDIGSQCRTILTMLPANDHVRHVYSSPDGILQFVQPGTLMIDSSTIDPDVAAEVASKATQLQCVMVDAPVSGGVGGAQAGTLTFMVGGPTPHFEKARNILSQMGKNLVHCGTQVGSGQVVKLCNNLVLGISMIGVSEGMNLGIAKGIDPKLLAEVFNTSTARCWSSDTYNPVPGVMDGVPSSREYEGGFGVDLMKKDLGLALAAAQSAGVELPLGNACTQLYKEISTAGAGQKDFGYVYKYLADRNK